MNQTNTVNVSKWRLNPFTYIAGSKALLWGGVAMGLASFISYFSFTHFDGALDIHFGAAGNYRVYLLEQLIAWACISIPFYVLGIWLSKSKIRFIDVAGTVSLARTITLPIALFGFAPIFPLDIANPVTLAIAAIPTLIFAIWMIILLFNAFVVSTNIRGNKAVVCCIIGLFTAEYLAKIVMYYVVQNLWKNA